MTPHKPLSGLRIGCFGKGGAGKSTVTVLLAEALTKIVRDLRVVDLGPDAVVLVPRTRIAESGC